MNKAQLIERICVEAELSKSQAGRALDAFTGAVTKQAAEGNDVSLIGFGTFSVKERAARTGRNPQTGAAIDIAARKSVSFKPGKGLKDAVNA